MITYSAIGGAAIPAEVVIVIVDEVRIGCVWKWSIPLEKMWMYSRLEVRGVSWTASWLIGWSVISWSSWFFWVVGEGRVGVSEGGRGRGRQRGITGRREGLRRPPGAAAVTAAAVAHSTQIYLSRPTVE